MSAHRGNMDSVWGTRKQRSDKPEAGLKDTLLWRYGSAVDCHRDRGSGYSRPGYGISPLRGGRH